MDYADNCYPWISDKCAERGYEMTREELRDYVEEQRSLNNIPYHVYSELIDGIDTLEQEPCEDAISRQAVNVRLEEVINEMETIFADIREKNVDDSVCGLCEYDCNHGLDGFANECPGFEKDDCFKLKDEHRKEWTNTEALPSVTSHLKTGRWVMKRIFPTKLYDEHLNEYECSECDRRIRCIESQLVNYPYCHCGAKMQEVEE